MHYRLASSHSGLDETVVRPMTEADLSAAHQLSIEVGWPHRPQDWRFIFDIGSGFVVCDPIGRVVGSAMWWPFGDEAAAVGMVIVSPRLQAQGTGGRLMEAVFAETKARGLRLNSTREGYPLYRSLGFKPVGRIFQRQGLARPTEEAIPSASGVIRAMKDADWPVLAQLDKQTLGLDRRCVFERLRENSTGIVVEQNDRPVGFSLCRPFGRGHSIGPVVATDDAMAIALCRPHVDRRIGRFLRLDTAREQGDFIRFLDRAGLPIYDTVTTMTLGPAPVASHPAQAYACVNQALG